MKLSLLVLGLTSLLVNALPTAKPAKTACYVEQVNGVDQEVCTGKGWHPTTSQPAPSTTSPPAVTIEKRQCMVLAQDADGTLHQKCGKTVIACKDGACQTAATPSTDTIVIHPDDS